MQHTGRASDGSYSLSDASQADAITIGGLWELRVIQPPIRREVMKSVTSPDAFLEAGSLDQKQPKRRTQHYQCCE